MISSVANDRCHEYRGLSTDTKPVDSTVGNGSVFLEMDTCKVYVFNETTHTWIVLEP